LVTETEFVGFVKAASALVGHFDALEKEINVRVRWKCSVEAWEVGRASPELTVKLDANRNTGIFSARAKK